MSDGRQASGVRLQSPHAGASSDVAGALRIRVGTADDAALLAERAETMFRDAFGADNDPSQMDAYCASHYGEEIQRAELDTATTRVLFVEEGEGQRPIAYAQLSLAAPDSVVQRFYVERGHHGKGVAQRLMEEALAAARQAGASRVSLSVWTENPRAIAFYEKAGFTISGTQPFVLGTEIQTDYVMTRDL